MICAIDLRRACSRANLTSESVDGLALPLESVDNVERCDGLSLSVFRVSDGISNDSLQERLQDSSGFFVDEPGDTLYTSSSRETSDLQVVSISISHRGPPRSHL